MDGSFTKSMVDRIDFLILLTHSTGIQKEFNILFIPPRSIQFILSSHSNTTQTSTITFKNSQQRYNTFKCLRHIIY
jgi:hypothetical protein